ncbi:MAG: CBS domain-containing protein [Nanoarchaeota archaeon]
MQTGVKVGDIMTRNFLFINPEVSVLNAIKLMVKNRVGSVLIVENEILKGILTERDIMWVFTKKNSKTDLAMIKSGDICTRKITTIKPSADVYDAVRLMKKAKFRRLPVTIEKKVIGLLTLKDILKIQPELFEIAREGYVIKEQAEKFKRKQTGESFKEGICEECGDFDILYNIDGNLICEECKEKM